MKGQESAGKDIPGNNMEVSDTKVMAIALHLYTAWSGPCIALMRREARGASGGSALALVGFHGDNEKRSRGRGPDMGVALRGSFDCSPSTVALRMGPFEWGSTGSPIAASGAAPDGPRTTSSLTRARSAARAFEVKRWSAP